MSELKPCPFCGGIAMFEEYTHPCCGKRWRVICTGCAAMVDPGYAQGKSVVEEMWNRRYTNGGNEK